ncbi:MAG: divalent cation tolerance protein [uncultured archaeon A07HB70]|jgi:CutA1 divalent ion tolerance protein.|nr:MAG: divalent cation tolerance protein [uncultured archaeon A07HB70]
MPDDRGDDDAEPTLALVTAPPDAAGDLARTLVEERLAACLTSSHA